MRHGRYGSLGDASYHLIEIEIEISEFCSIIWKVNAAAVILINLMERMMDFGAPPMTQERYMQVAALWSMAENSSSNSVQGFAWNISVERNSAGNVIQLVATGSGCTMLVNIGEWHHVVAGAVDPFFYSNGELLAKIVAQD
jgi:hypothetical protein